MNLRSPARVAVLVALSMVGAVTIRAEETKRPKDAAEAVQEGNVKNWVEYYERTREAQRTTARPPPAATDTPPPKEPAPATTPPR
jgi:hypothetical protein